MLGLDERVEDDSEVKSDKSLPAINDGSVVARHKIKPFVFAGWGLGRCEDVDPVREVDDSTPGLDDPSCSFVRDPFMEEVLRADANKLSLKSCCTSKSELPSKSS